MDAAKQQQCAEELDSDQANPDDHAKPPYQA
jgi:hypothetical protein